MRLKSCLVIVSLLCAVSAQAALVPCGQHPMELAHPSLVWKKFIDVAVRSRFADMDAVICAGKIAGSSLAERVTYRDADGQTQVARTIEELRNFQVLINAHDLPASIGGMVRTGGLVSLRIGEPRTEGENGVTHYPVAVRFHRALGRNVASDIREITLNAQLDYERDQARAERGGKFFDVLKIYIGVLPTRMEQIVLKEGTTTVDNFFTSTLERVGRLE